MTRIRSIVRESFAVAWSQPVASILTVVMVAGMCATVQLTTGRTVGTEQAVLSSIDSTGTRSVLIRDNDQSGLDTSVLTRLSAINGIEWAGAFGPPEDTTNAAIPNGTKVPLRSLFADDLGALGIPDSEVSNIDEQGDVVFASASAAEQLGLLDGSGGIAVPATGASHSVRTGLNVPEYLAFLEPLIVAPVISSDTEADERVSLLVIIADAPRLVAPIARTAESLLGTLDPGTVSISTSEGLASLRAMVHGELSSSSRSLVVVIFTITALLVAAILYGLVMLRRKDFGRRRALGASQHLIVILVLGQTGILSAIGALFGSAIAAIVLGVSHDPLPSGAFFAAIAVLAIASGVAAAAVPAIAAARRDPITELRVP